MKHDILNLKQWYLKHKKRHQLCHYDDAYGLTILGVAAFIVVIIVIGSISMVWNGA